MYSVHTTPDKCSPNNLNITMMNSPIGKIIVENISPLHSTQRFSHGSTSQCTPQTNSVKRTLFSSEPSSKRFNSGKIIYYNKVQVYL